MAEIYYYRNDNLIELIGLKNAATGAYVNDATVRVTAFRDGAGNDVTGETWPLAVPYVASSDGDYRATLVDTLGVALGETYTATITADAGSGLNAEWTVPVRVKERKP